MIEILVLLGILLIVRVDMDIFNGQERKIRCIDKYDTSPYGCEYELLEVGKEYTVTDIYVYGFFTMIHFKEFPNQEFNSVLFEEIAESEEK